MAGLSGLKLVAAQRTMTVPAVQQRRNKLVKRIWEQTELAKARAGVGDFNPKRLRTYRDPETGAKKQIEAPKRVKPWWFTTDNGKLALSVRYGARVLELAKGKWAVEVGTKRELVAVLDTIKAAVLAGELDAQIEAASTTLRAGFKR